MTSRRHLCVTLCALATLSSAACSSVRPYAIEFTPAYIHHENSKVTTRSAESCLFSVLSLVSVGDASMEGAMANLGGSNAGIKLTYITVDMVSTDYILVTTECVRVTGHFIDTNARTPSTPAPPI